MENEDFILNEERFELLANLYILQQRRAPRCELFKHNGEKLIQYFDHPEVFKAHFKMSVNCFNVIFELVRDDLTKKRRDAISPTEQLLITLRYFVTGMSFRQLATEVRRGRDTVCRIVHNCAEVIWRRLQPVYMPKPDARTWETIRNRFHELWNLPNCLGAIDGKHIRIKAPRHTGAQFFNYKGFYSIILLAVADANGKFITIDMGEYGRNSDGRAFSESNFGQALMRHQLDLPAPKELPGENVKLPHYFIGDEAFPLQQQLMKPFSRREGNINSIIFNNRLSRARKCVECAFGVMTAKFQLLQRPILVEIKNTDIIVQSICVLHNAIKDIEGIFSIPTHPNLLTNYPPLQLSISNPKQTREYLLEYFLHRAPIPNQDRYL